MASRPTTSNIQDPTPIRAMSVDHCGYPMGRGQFAAKLALPASTRERDGNGYKLCTI